MRYVRTWFVEGQNRCRDNEAAYFVEIGDDGWMVREVALNAAGDPIDARAKFGVFDAHPFEMPDDQVEVITPLAFEQAWSLAQQVAELRHRESAERNARIYGAFLIVVIGAVASALCFAVGSSTNASFWAAAGMLCMLLAIGLAIVRLWRMG